MAQRGDDAFQFADVFMRGIQLVAQLSSGRFQDHGPATRRQRILGFVQSDFEFVVRVNHMQFLIFEHAAILIAQYRQ
jgi:predicted methyltransferase MtxX (methanogen marker protein 4)